MLNSFNLDKQNKPLEDKVTLIYSIPPRSTITAASFDT